MDTQEERFRNFCERTGFKPTKQTKNNWKKREERLALERRDALLKFYHDIDTE